MPHLFRKTQILFGIFLSIGLIGVTHFFNEYTQFKELNQLESTISKLKTESNLNSVLNSEKLPISIENFSTGTLIIPMDNTYQGSGNDFNLKAYGLLVRLLHAGVPLKWAIKTGKNKDGIDFSANAKRIKPSITGSANRDFRAGPFIVYPGFESQAMNVINSFGNNVSVYELTQNAAIEIKHDILHKPKAALLNNGGNSKIHRKIYEAAGLIKNTHYVEVNSAGSLNNNSCFTFASEPHTKPSQINSSIVNQVKIFVQSGGNFLAQCEGVEAYTSSSNGSLLATYNSKNGGGNNISYDNHDEPYAQFHGILKNEGGSVKDFKFNSNPGDRVAYKANNYYKAYAGKISGVTANAGGYVHYLAGHEYKSGLTGTNGKRMVLNALMRPSERPNNCNLTICEGITNAGSISGGGTWCTSTPSLPLTIPVISNTTSASGGSGGSIQYQWQRKINNGNWTDIPGATSDKYNPPNNGYTIGNTRYRRRAKRTCSNNWIASNEVLVYIQQYFSNAGSIGSNQTNCSSYNPANISGSNPSGGGGNPAEYRWQYRTNGGWININNATGNSYDPGTINVTTQYRRGTRRSGCYNSYIYTNTVTKAVNNVAINLICEYKINGTYWVQNDCSMDICAGNKLELSVNPNGLSSYAWTGPNGFSYTSNSSSDVLISNNITTAMAGTYTAIATDANGCSGVKQFTVNVTSSYTNPGSINSNQTNCGSYNPANINGSNPSGGNGGGAQYQWQYRTNGSWININNANAANYDPGNINVTTQFRRGAKRSGCTTFIYSNTVTKTVTSNFSNAGSIASNQTNCGSYNPANITGSNPSGGNGSGAQYQWQYRTNGSWININNANAANYDPGNINVTTQFRRGAKRSGCTTFIYSNTVTKNVDQPIAIPGSIDGGNTYCGSGNPNIISSSSPASGGIGGNIIYQWQYRNGTSGNWSNVAGATGLTYDPPNLTSTRQYRRAAKRTICGDWIYSNIITFIVNSNPITQPATLISCDLANGTGIGQFILSDAFPQIIVNLTNIEITFHNTLFDAQNGISQLVSPIMSTSTIIFCRVENISTNCFEINTITLNVGNICLENCTNGKDEDGDGLIDCDDPDCACCKANAPTLSKLKKN